MSLTEKSPNPDRSCILTNDVKSVARDSPYKHVSYQAKEHISNPKRKDSKTNKTIGEAKSGRGKIRMPLQRQRTFTTSIYRYRKSISQIDMKLARRNGLLQFSPLHKNRLNSNGENEAAQNGNGSYFSFESTNLDPQLAGMRVSITFMLNAWRKRRDEVKTLKDLLNELKKSNVKAKNQLHVFNALFNVEKKSNEELSLQLKSAIDQIRSLQESEKNLKNELHQSEAKRSDVDLQLKRKTEDHAALNVFFKQTKTELFGVMSELQETCTKLATAQMKVNQLEEEKLQMIKSVALMCELTSEGEQKLQRSLEAKEAELLSLQIKAKDLETELVNSKECLGAQVSNLTNNEVKLKAELEALHTEAKILRRCLAATVGQRMKNCWKNSILVQRATFNMVHWFAASLLPAVPAPRMSSPLPFNFTLEKAMNIMKR